MIIDNTNTLLIRNMRNPQILDKRVAMLLEKRAISGSIGFYNLLFLRIGEHI